MLAIGEHAVSGSHFLFVFKNDFTKQVKRYVLHYNRIGEIWLSFSFRLMGLGSMSPSGFWSYDVYEQQSDTNIDPVNATYIQSGKAHVIGESSTNFTYENPTDRNYVYTNS